MTYARAPFRARINPSYFGADINILFSKIILLYIFRGGAKKQPVPWPGGPGYNGAYGYSEKKVWQTCSLYRGLSVHFLKKIIFNQKNSSIFSIFSKSVFPPLYNHEMIGLICGEVKVGWPLLAIPVVQNTVRIQQVQVEVPLWDLPLLILQVAVVSR